MYEPLFLGLWLDIRLTGKVDPFRHLIGKNHSNSYTQSFLLLKSIFCRANLGKKAQPEEEKDGAASPIKCSFHSHLESI